MIKWKDNRHFNVEWKEKLWFFVAFCVHFTFHGLSVYPVWVWNKVSETFTSLSKYDSEPLKPEDPSWGHNQEAGSFHTTNWWEASITWISCAPTMVGSMQAGIGSTCSSVSSGECVCSVDEVQWTPDSEQACLLIQRPQAWLDQRSDQRLRVRLGCVFATCNQVFLKNHN